MPTVTRVRMERSDSSAHEHIKGVCTTADNYYTRKEVVESIRGGTEWWASGGGQTVKIHPIASCPGCSATPYITTRPDNTAQDNLDKLPRC